MHWTGSDPDGENLLYRYTVAPVLEESGPDWDHSAVSGVVSGDCGEDIDEFISLSRAIHLEYAWRVSAEDPTGGQGGTSDWAYGSFELH